MMTDDEFEAFLAKRSTTMGHILDRFNKQYPIDFSIGEGWWPLVIDLNAKLAAIDPDYTILQIKEKFGTLRYYCSHSGSPEFRALIEAAEMESSKTCEDCGSKENVTTSTLPSGFWIRTLCDTCREAISAEQDT